MSLLIDYPHLQVIQNLAKTKKVKVYMVGGFLRDSLLQRRCLDFDFAVEKDAIGLARRFASRIKGAFVLLDQEHGCARVAKKTGDAVHTFDFADFRAPTLSKDLLHRDFTINTLTVDVNNLTAATQLNKAMGDARKARRDLKFKKIRMVSNKAFREDPLRVMRAFSLRALLGFTIERKTLDQIKKDKDRITDVSYERIRDELFKILESPRCFDNLKAMDRIGLLEKIIPQIHVMYNCRQGGYHHLDVWPHSLEAVNQMEKMLADIEPDEDIRNYIRAPIGGQRTRWAMMKLAALLHDIGKPETRKKEGARISFHAHEIVGKSIVRNVAKLLKLSTQERFALEDMVLWHLRPGYLSNFKNPSPKSIFRYFRDTKEEAASIALLSLADQRATRGPLTTEEDQKHHEKICRNLIATFFAKKKEKPCVRLIDGHDLIKQLKLKPSPLFGKILSTVEERQATGKIHTKEEALALAREILKT